MPALVLGPILRHVGATDATVWVETSEPCEVDVAGRRDRTFTVEGHHYALVVVDGLEPGSSTEYEVALDGRRVWPDDELALPPSSIRTLAPGRPVRLVFGSCRTAGPHEPPFTRRRASDPRGLGIDALRALAIRAAGDPQEGWPDALLMLGDQVYADQPSVRIAEFVAEHESGSGAPPDQIEDFTEYARAYRDAWSDRYVRWLLSAVPSSMIFDDHEIHDEWKISQAWVDDMRGHEWYDRRLTSGIMAYWLYQHLGNLSPAELRDHNVLARVRAERDGGSILRSYARDADRQSGASRWSFCRDLGRTRLVVFDARGGRELTPGRRRIVNRPEWEWLEQRTRGDFDHLLLASSIPFYVSHGMHWFEAWLEAIADGAWGPAAARVGESMRQRANAGHWAAFQHSFHELAGLLDAIARGGAGAPPHSVVMLSGDVHHCYLAEVELPGGASGHPPMWQAVCSGMRKQIDPREKIAMKVANSGAAGVVARGLARAAGVAPAPTHWRLVEEPHYVNQIATLALDGPEAELVVETTAGADWRDPQLRPLFRRQLS